MNKRLIIVLLVFVSAVSAVTAQTDSLITDLAAQRIQGRLAITGALSGLGSTANTLGEGVVWPEGDASAVTWNPAGLGMLKDRSLVIDWSPGFLQEISNLYDVDTEIQSAFDSVIEDNGKAGALAAGPTTQMQAGIPPSLASFGLAVPLQIKEMTVGFGFAYSSPLMMQMQLMGTGIDAGIEVNEEIQGEAKLIRMRVGANLNASMDVNLRRIDLGTGISFKNGTAVGISFYKLKMQMKSQAHAEIDGIIEMSGSEYAFNDPYDPKIDFEGGEQNDLNQSFMMNYTGSGWGMQLGVIQRLNKFIHLGFSMNMPPRLDLSGRDSSVNNRIPFLNLSGGSNDEDEGDDGMFDPLAINLAKLTKTEALISVNDFSPKITLPGTMNFGAVFGGPHVNFSIRYTIYQNAFSLGLLSDELWRLKMKYGFGVGINLKYFFIGASGSFADFLQIKEQSLDPPEITENVILPGVNVGLRIPTFKGLWVDGLFGMEPTPNLRLTFRYSF